MKSPETGSDSPRDGLRLASSFRQIAEQAADGIVVADPGGRVLYANPAAALMLGAAPAQMRQAPVDWPLAAGETAEILLRRADRTTANIELRVTELDWDGTPVLLATLHDITAQRVAEADLRQARKMESVGRLAAGIVHDFNNILAVFDAGLNLLHAQLAKSPANPQVDAIFEQMRKRIQNGGALTQQLLALMRHQPPAPEKVDLGERIAALASLIDSTLGCGVRIEVKAEPELRPVHIDPNQFDVAILNLAVNARDAMPDGGTLTIEAGKDDSAHAQLPGACFVRVTVRDTGCGMSHETAARAFEPFFTTKDEGKGTGLGLSQIHDFVTQCGGHVRIDSEPGRGTSVHLLFPCADGREWSADAGDDRAHETRGGLHLPGIGLRPDRDPAPAFQ